MEPRWNSSWNTVRKTSTADSAPSEKTTMEPSLRVTPFGTEANGLTRLMSSVRRTTCTAGESTTRRRADATACLTASSESWGSVRLRGWSGTFRRPRFGLAGQLGCRNILMPARRRVTSTLRARIALTWCSTQTPTAGLLRQHTPWLAAAAFAASRVSNVVKRSQFPD